MFLEEWNAEDDFEEVAMICYLPFTEIAEKPLDIMTKALGPITIYGPTEALATEPMHAWRRKGLLDLRTPTGLDHGQFEAALSAHKNWAQLHDGHISDMVHFYNTHKGRQPLMDENAPTQISTQIRHHGEVKNKAGDPIMQAALFLALAQEYDLNQARLSQEMGRVAEMERAMYATIGSGDDRSELMAGHAVGTTQGTAHQDLGTYMTDQRIQAWAWIASDDAQPTWAYVTPSAAVFDQLKGLRSDVVDLAVWHLSPQGDTEDLKQARQAAIQVISRSKDLDALSLDPELSGEGTHGALTLTLVGLHGSLFESILPKDNLERLQSQRKAPVNTSWQNTVLGLIG